MTTIDDFHACMEAGADYWDCVTPEIYEGAPALTGWPWCEPGTWPSSHAWEAPCVAEDPCIEGGYTLWTVLPCEVAVEMGAPLTGIESGVAMPPLELPATGAEFTLGLTGISLALVLSGVFLLRRVHLSE